MLKLIRTGRFDTLPEASAFTFKLEAWVRMAGISHETQLGSIHEFAAITPRRLLPFVELDGEIIGDTSSIIERLKQQYNDPLNDARLNDGENALGTLVKSLCEHELFFIMIHGRWIDGDADAFVNFVTRDLPEDQRAAAIAGSKEMVIDGMLDVLRLGRYDNEYVRSALREKLDALSHFLGDKRYLFGDAPSTYDAGLFSQLSSIIHYPIPNPQVAIAREYDSLVSYCDRIKAEIYPTSEWVDGA